MRKPTRIEVDGVRFARTCTWGNRGAETLVRHNLEKMIREAKAVGKKAIAENNFDLLIDMCLEPFSGFCRADFLDTKNNTMKGDQRGVQEVIKQFFKDVDFMEKLKGEIKREFEDEKKAVPEKS